MTDIPDDHTPINHPLATPPGWRLLQRSTDGYQWRLPGGRMVIASTSWEGGQRWVHLSMSHPSRLPTWPELVEMRNLLLGDDVEAYQVLPPANRYVNLHNRVLHLWACLDSPSGVLPHFEGFLSEGIASI